MRGMAYKLPGKVYTNLLLGRGVKKRKYKKLRKLIRQEIRAVLAEMVEPPIYPSDANMDQMLSELLNITKESVARSGEYSFNVTAWNQLAGEEPNVSC